jgi:transposase
MAITSPQRLGKNSPTSPLLLAFDLGLKSWKLGFARDFNDTPWVREIAGGDRQALLTAIAQAKRQFKLSAATPVRSCYEAGRDGFWLHRFLAHHGVQNVVVDSSSIAVERQARRAKTDRLDVRKLLTMLIRHVGGEPGVWKLVHVPTGEEEDGRVLHRELRPLTKESTRCSNRIKGWLITQGVRVARLPKDFPTWVARVQLWDGSCLPLALRQRLERESERWHLVQQQITTLQAPRRAQLATGEDPALTQVQQLQQLRGIGPESAWVYVREFFGWRRFRNRREVGALAGLTPTPFQSGEATREQGIGKAGNRYVRGMAIEIAWGWVHRQPTSALSQWYRRRFGGGGVRQRKIGIVALARKLLVALWRYLDQGVVPAGALMKS